MIGKKERITGVIDEILKEVFFDKKNYIWKRQSRRIKTDESIFINLDHRIKAEKQMEKDLKKVFIKWRDRLMKNFDKVIKDRTKKFLLIFKQEENLDDLTNEEISSNTTNANEMKKILIKHMENYDIITNADVTESMKKKLPEIEVKPTLKTIPVRRKKQITNYAERFSNIKVVEIDNRIMREITYGLENGLSIPQIQKRCRDYYNLSVNDIQLKRIVATEITRAEANSTLATYTRNGIEMYNLQAALDACPICVDLESGNPYKIDDIGALPPIHPSCRCTITPVIDF